MFLNPFNIFTAFIIKRDAEEREEDSVFFFVYALLFSVDLFMPTFYKSFIVDNYNDEVSDDYYLAHPTLLSIGKMLAIIIYFILFAITMFSLSKYILLGAFVQVSSTILQIFLLLIISYLYHKCAFILYEDILEYDELNPSFWCTLYLFLPHVVLVWYIVSELRVNDLEVPIEFYMYLILSIIVVLSTLATLSSSVFFFLG